MKYWLFVLSRQLRNRPFRPGLSDDLSGTVCKSQSGSRQFEIPTQHVRQLHLVRTLAVRLEQARVRNEDARASGSGCGHVEAVHVVEKLHAAGRIFGRRRCHRVDHYRRLLPLELVNRADAEIW